MYSCNDKTYTCLDDLEKDFDCDYLDSRSENGYEFIRVTTDDGAEDSAWYCAECESTDVDLCGMFGAVCHNCEGE